MNLTSRWLNGLVAIAGALLCASAFAGAPAYTITARPSPEAGGTITLDPAGPYQKNNIVVVTAVPFTGYVFDHWAEDLSGTANPTKLRVSRNHTVVAVFTETGSGGGGGGGGGGTVTPTPLPDKQLVVGYFTQWSIYRRNYLVRDVESSGAAEAMNVINYAFAAPDENLRCASLDTFADYGKRFDASESVDGVADTVAQPLKGNFNQLLKLKQMHPHLRVLISLGGWTQSFRFSDAALPANREAFVESCIDMFIRGNVAPGISAAGVFDGIDVDWEYPGSCGETCSSRPADDVKNFTALLAEFRAQLEDLEGEVETATGTRPEYLLTIAAPAGAAHYGPILDDTGEKDPTHVTQMVDALDWINIMAYDFHGSWEPAGPTNHHAALYASTCESVNGDWGDKAVGAYLFAGVPRNKLLLGVPFYGRGWRGVAAVGDGLCQPAGGVPRGVYEKGINDYEVLDAQGRHDFYGDGTHWTFNGSEFWSYDDAQSLGVKAGYVNDRDRPLRGLMFWELSGDAPDGRLLKALRESLGTAPAPAQ
jgi:chitinase